MIPCKSPLEKEVIKLDKKKGNKKIDYKRLIITALITAIIGIVKEVIIYLLKSLISGL